MERFLEAFSWAFTEPKLEACTVCICHFESISDPEQDRERSMRYNYHELLRDRKNATKSEADRLVLGIGFINIQQWEPTIKCSIESHQG